MQKEVRYMHIFDYSFLDNGLLPAEMVSVTAAVSSFKTISAVLKEKNPAAYESLEKIARIQSVKGSNAIEGIVTSDARLREIVNGSSAPLNHNEAEIAGYRDALDLIHSGYGELSFSEPFVLQLHRMLLEYTGSEEAGHYKQEDNLIIEISGGKRLVRFEPVPAKETQTAMQQLILAYCEARDNPKINRLLLIPCVILDFLCIHPFADGNGRISRLLSLLLLYKNGYDIGRYISFEQQTNEAKDSYYAALQYSSAGWHENKNEYFAFMQNFLSLLYACYKELDKRFAAVRSGTIRKGILIEQTVLNSILPVSKAQICERLPEVSPTTVEAVLGKMVKNGAVRKIGSGRNTKYVNADRIRD